ncbi:leucyl aminopeptidase [Rhodococcus sp. X156]|uniref:leucyl aminopeptidase n=1 Tax=Rhodococcus sp. X156 TaxID=2499145 RepID=UPI001F49DAD2|nr:leucyl aminopeptidase [Rhodococcus sp. X156]
MPTTPELRLVEEVEGGVDVLVVGLLKGSNGDSPSPELVGADVLGGSELLAELAVLGATGSAGEVTKLPTRGAVGAATLLAVGLGALEEGTSAPTGEQVRRAAGVAARALAGTARAATTLSTVDLGATAEGVILGSYVFTAYKSEAGKAPLARMDLVVPDAADSAAKAALARSTAIGGAVATARELINTPPNDLFPASFADRAAALGKAAGLKVEVLDEKALAKGGYGGLLGVGQGSSRPPRLVRLSYTGGKRGKPSVALVGKGITFDTGGISIKPAAGMDAMTSDMSGAAAVVATVVLAAQLALPINVTATVPMAENMPSGTAQRPGDVLTQYGGTTVEVLNTDAEGRLVLADAIVRACEDNPDYLIDTATLTGAQMVALGNRTPGVMGTESFRDRVAVISREVGEGGWAMPLPAELRAELDSPIADLANVAGNRWAGMLVAGTYLKEFVADGVQWAHIDIAGPSYNTGSPHGYTGKGGTGVPVRTMIAVLEDIAEHG